jgi:hypothetical protein
VRIAVSLPQRAAGIDVIRDREHQLAQPRVVARRDDLCEASLVRVAELDHVREHLAAAGGEHDEARARVGPRGPHPIEGRRPFLVRVIEIAEWS